MNGSAPVLSLVLLLPLVLGCATTPPSREAGSDRTWLPTIVPGTTRVADLRQALGAPTRSMAADRVHVWQLLLVEDAEPLSQNALAQRLAARQEDGAWQRMQQTGRLVTLQPEDGNRLWALSRIEEYSLVVMERDGLVARATLIRVPP